MKIDVDSIQDFVSGFVNHSATDHAEIIVQEAPKDGVASFKINGWTLYSYEKLPTELESFAKNVQEKGMPVLGEEKDSALIHEKNPLIRMIAEKQMGNHSYCVYLDYRYGSMNRQILMCDERWICVRENNIGELMAFAEYLNTNEKFGAFEKLDEDGILAVTITKEM